MFFIYSGIGLVVIGVWVFWESSVVEGNCFVMELNIVFVLGFVEWFDLVRGFCWYCVMFIWSDFDWLI